ncbi:MAG: glycosyltransferase [Flavobacteriales bacterium]|nr:glycosyltransferase [Flavobacteriales bacterium]MCB9193629.1 glycosyltransferase [Flavobacteriales bacterium]
MQRTVILFTMRFPFGRGETFLENELPVLCDLAERVVVVPQFPDGAARPLPANAQVRTLPGDPYARATLRELLTWSGPARKLWRSLRQDAPDVPSWRSERRALFQRTLQAVHRAHLLRDLLRDPSMEGGRLYTYWLHDWVTALGLLHERDPRLRFVSRAHGFDLYEHQHARGWIPFRSFQLEHVDRVFAVSGSGLEHLRARHPRYMEKFALRHLGTTDHGPGPWAPPDPLHIASCAHLIPRKRLLLWARVLEQVRIPVRWTHFGDGVERGALEKAISRLPANVQVDLKGDRDNARIMDWYGEVPVHLFVLFSELEGGVAVAAQEAASFGIPLLVTDSGGVRDLVNERTGRLLPRDPDPGEVARWVEEYPESAWCTPSARDRVRAFWEQHFRAENTFGRFAMEVLGASD